MRRFLFHFFFWLSHWKHSHKIETRETNCACVCVCEGPKWKFCFLWHDIHLNCSFGRKLNHLNMMITKNGDDAIADDKCVKLCVNFIQITAAVTFKRRNYCFFFFSLYFFSIQSKVNRMENQKQNRLKWIVLIKKTLT